MTSRLLFLIFGLACLGMLVYLTWSSSSPVSPHIPRPLWEMRSIDTMKYSRDLSREKLNDPSFDKLIDLQMAAIASAGATHVAIATPYDHEFLPILRRWVDSARRHNLHIWFRGNMSGWEGWFDYPLMSTAQHTQGIVDFVEGNPTLFANGDYFSSCPECENGHLGDPRLKWSVGDYRAFLISEHQAASAAFRQIGKNVDISLNSMNYDVATLIMDQETTRALGGVVAIDHYVRDPLQIARDVETIATKSGGRVYLGEFGAPIPDLHGKQSESEQAQWIETALSSLAQSKSLIGINYWVNVGGSTAIWRDDNTPKPAVETLSQYYHLRN